MALFLSRGKRMRKTLAEEFGKMLDADKMVAILYGDISFDELNALQKKFPKNIFNVGISEQSMVSFAAGMAFAGYKVYVYTVTPFLIERAFEQIKLDVDNTKLDVNLIGFTNYNNQGITHEELDCEKTMSMFKDIKSFYPKTRDELLDAISQSYKTETPTFMKVLRL